MLPGTLLGLVVFAAAAGPGYLYVRLSRAREPRYERTTLEEAAEFVVFGALSSGFAILLTLGITEDVGFLESGAIKHDALAYTVDEPLRVLAALALVILISYGVVWLLAKPLFRGGTKISPGETGWYAAFHRMLPEQHGAYVTVDLRDGRAISGLVVAYTPDNDEPREILLSRPVGGSLWLRHANGQGKELADSFIALKSPDILAVSGRYTPLAEAPPKKKWWKRRLRFV
ncbi:MAG TPA: DUF6338 family protein [Solirubrobacterales bacterium]|nr:DUF6338 family protein [Solirubrobacterales bacterium]